MIATAVAGTSEEGSGRAVRGESVRSEKRNGDGELRAKEQCEVG